MAQLVLIRHGQSAWNLENRFTGWWDVNLTEKGVAEAKAAGAALAAQGYDFDVAFTSLQTRAIKTLNLVLEEMGRRWLPVTSRPTEASGASALASPLEAKTSTGPTEARASESKVRGAVVREALWSLTTTVVSCSSRMSRLSP